MYFYFRHYKFPIPHPPTDAVGDVLISIQPNTVAGDGYEIPTPLQNGDGYSEIPGVVIESPGYATVAGDYENWGGGTPTLARTHWDMSTYAVVDLASPAPVYGLVSQSEVKLKESERFLPVFTRFPQIPTSTSVNTEPIYAGFEGFIMINTPTDTWYHQSEEDL